MHSKTDVVKKILSRIGKNVMFRFPGTEGKKCGMLKDRMVVLSSDEKTGIPYWDVVDLIKFPDEREKDWIRIGYYRKPKERLVWGSQTTITEPVTVWKHILVETAREKPWFRTLLQEVVREM